MRKEPIRSNLRRRRKWFHPVALLSGLAARPKLYVSVGAAVIILALMPPGYPWSARAVVAWNTGALFFLGLEFAMMTRCPSDAIRKQSQDEDETRFVFFALILVAVASSVSAVVGLIGEARAASATLKELYFAFAAAAIMISWLVMQVVFTLHYAHDYYCNAAEGEGIVGGLVFPGGEEPDYWDFFYFTTSIGATSQTSDVLITSKSLRRMVAFQAVLSFVFSTTIVALAINLAAGML